MGESDQGRRPRGSEISPDVARFAQAPSRRSAPVTFYGDAVHFRHQCRRSYRHDLNFEFNFNSERAIAMRTDHDGQLPDKHDWQARAAEALEKARKMKPGAERTAALKKA